MISDYPNILGVLSYRVLNETVKMAVSSSEPDFLSVLRRVGCSLKNGNIPSLNLKPLQMKCFEYMLKVQCSFEETTFTRRVHLFTHPCYETDLHYSHTFHAHSTRMHSHACSTVRMFLKSYLLDLTSQCSSTPRPQARKRPGNEVVTNSVFVRTGENVNDWSL